MFGDIEIPYQAGSYNIRGITGRTIHSDGTVIPFTGKPYDKLLVKEGKERVMAKVFSMPDVQVGSIVEYRWILGYDDGIRRSPSWQIQQRVPMLKASLPLCSELCSQRRLNADHNERARPREYGESASLYLYTAAGSERATRSGWL